VAALVFLGAIALAPSVYRSRLRTIGRVLVLSTLVLVACLAAYAGVAFVELTFLWPSGQVVDGDFVVRIWSGPDRSGGTTEIRALYFRGSGVTERLRRYVHHSTRPAVVIYERYESGGEVATYAFDGETFRTLRLTLFHGIPVDPDHQWSPDKTRLVLDVDGLYLFDVARWRVSRFTGEGALPKDLHSVNLAGWSPGSRRFAVIDPGRPPFPNQRPVVLAEWDAETLMARVVGCMPEVPGRAPWQDTDFAWQADSLVITAQWAQDARCAATLQ
jgi:hypothetical protein